MILRTWRARIASLAAPTMLLVATPAYSGWETGAKAGFDANLSRSIDDGEGSGYLSAHAGYWKGHAAETRLDWTLGFLVEGAEYPSLPDVSYAAATLSPGVAYIFRPGWTSALTAFLQGKSVNDTEQSAWTFGGRLDFSQKFRNGIYLGEYFFHSDSRANEDIYSYAENTFGIVLGMRWTPRVFTEAGAEFSRGDSFFSRSAPTQPAGGGGSGMGWGRYSSAFGTEVSKETADRRALSVSAGVDWTPSWFSTVNCTYSAWDADSGSADGSSGYVGMGYRFGNPDR